ncbi:MAG: hypothetical protein KA390_06310, partial [Trichococcus sp.]|nr:hypothetical protein [Trichococcus sp.]
MTGLSIDATSDSVWISVYADFSFFYLFRKPTPQRLLGSLRFFCVQQCVADPDWDMCGKSNFKKWRSFDDEKWDKKHVAIELGNGDRVVGCLR